MRDLGPVLSLHCTMSFDNLSQIVKPTRILSSIKTKEKVKKPTNQQEENWIFEIPLV